MCSTTSQAAAGRGRADAAVRHRPPAPDPAPSGTKRDTTAPAARRAAAHPRQEPPELHPSITESVTWNQPGKMGCERKGNGRAWTGRGKALASFMVPFLELI